MSNDYWSSPKGLAKRIMMFSLDFTFGIQNKALQVYGGNEDVWGFEWEGNIDERTCDYCDARIGHQYRLGMFLPRLPAHANCRCGWRLIPRSEME
jgi:hypothetical protein